MCQIPTFIVLLSLATSASAAPATQPAPESKVVHVFVALCDNENQGIAPVPAKLGNGQDPANNLYWGAMYGVKTFFRMHDWHLLVHPAASTSKAVLERCCFSATIRGMPVYVVADAYDGSRMPEALGDFLAAAAGREAITMAADADTARVHFTAGGGADLVCFVGHNGLMDADAARAPIREGSAGPKSAMVLACKSQSYFEKPLERAGCAPLVTTTGLMAPEAYVLDAAVRAWVAGEPPQTIRVNAAAAYSKYQKCSIAAARRLFDASQQSNSGASAVK